MRCPRAAAACLPLGLALGLILAWASPGAALLVLDPNKGKDERPPQAAGQAVKTPPEQTTMVFQAACDAPMAQCQVTGQTTAVKVYCVLPQSGDTSWTCPRVGGTCQSSSGRTFPAPASPCQLCGACQKNPKDWDRVWP